MAFSNSVRVRDDIDLGSGSETGSSLSLGTEDEIRAYANRMACAAVGMVRPAQCSTAVSSASGDASINTAEPRNLVDR